MKKIIVFLLLVALAVVGYKMENTLWECMATRKTVSIPVPAVPDNELNALSLATEELRYADLLHDSWAGSVWLKNKQFSPNKAAANYSFLYILFRVLDETHPAAVLEFGLGQTTQMTMQFAKHFRTRLDVVEDDEQWIEIYKNRLPSSAKANIHLKPVQVFSAGGQFSEKYEDLSDIVKDTRYNLIIIDGPIGYRSYLSRANILELVPQNLAEDWVIIFDDVNRDAEKRTLKKLETLLKENNISYSKALYPALKTQAVLAGGNYKYVTLL